MKNSSPAGPSGSRPPQDRSALKPSALFGAWQRSVSYTASAAARAFGRIKTIPKAWWAQWPRVRDYHRASSRPWTPSEDLTRETAAALGVRGFIFGLVVAAVIASASKNTWVPGAVTILSEVLWAGARFMILALLAPAGAIDRRRLSAAYLAGLLPYALAVTPPLRVLALVLSAIATYRGLLGAGLAQQDARIMVGWSFGGQAAVVVGGLLIRVLVATIAL